MCLPRRCMLAPTLTSQSANTTQGWPSSTMGKWSSTSYTQGHCNSTLKCGMTSGISTGAVAQDGHRTSTSSRGRKAALRESMPGGR